MRMVESAYQSKFLDPLGKAFSDALKEQGTGISRELKCHGTSTRKFRIRTIRSVLLLFQMDSVMRLAENCMRR